MSPISRCTASIAAIPCAAAASSTWDLACVATSRYRPSARRLEEPPSDATRSSAPHISAETFGIAATSGAASTPAAVSQRASTSNSSSSTRSAVPSHLASMTVR